MHGYCIPDVNCTVTKLLQDSLAEDDDDDDEYGDDSPEHAEAVQQAEPPNAPPVVDVSSQEPETPAPTAAPVPSNAGATGAPANSASHDLSFLDRCDNCSFGQPAFFYTHVFHGPNASSKLGRASIDERLAAAKKRLEE